jgi:gliding motility associated protien GldN
MKKFSAMILPAALLVAGSIKAQVLTGENNVETGTPSIFFEANNKLYLDEHTAYKKPIQYDYLRAANVSWEKRMWRTIDLREKINQPMMFPVTPSQNRISLADLIKEGIGKDQLTVFRDDGFKTALSKEQALSKFTIKRVVKRVDENGDPLPDTIIYEPLSSDKVVQYVVKEDWYFEKERGAQEVRILGICPVYYDDDKQVYIDLGWIYFPQARPLLASHNSYNPKNDAASLTYDELFQKRFFNSYITKESNVYDRSINEYAVGLEALLEGEKIKTKIFQWEHDLWHF